MPLPHRPLVRLVSRCRIIGYSTAPLGKIKLMDVSLLNKSTKLLDYAIDQGITYLDASPDYGSQPKLGEIWKRRLRPTVRSVGWKGRQRAGAGRVLAERSAIGHALSIYLQTDAFRTREHTLSRPDVVAPVPCNRHLPPFQIIIARSNEHKHEETHG
jgi:hypothetical protein